MKILKGSIIVLVSLILFTSCTQTQRIDSNLEDYNIELRYGIKYYKKTAFTGEIFQNFENGQLESKENYKDGIRNGVFEYYSENGQLKQKENYKDGVENGVFEYYFENGQLKFKYNIGASDGQTVKYEGLFESYYENGQLKSKKNYKDGIRNGVFESYYENGQLAEKKIWEDGVENGLFEKYYENGQLKQNKNYKDGIRDGIYESYYENGKLNEKLGEGEYKSYYENGKLKEVKTYKDQNQNGLYESYFENGQLESKGNYKPAEMTSELLEQFNQAKLVYGLEELAPLNSGVILLRNGVFESYYENGQLKAVKTYKDGIYYGLFESYYKNGQLAEKENYKDGNRDGLFESYYENGQLKSKEKYKDGLDITFSYKSRNINVSEIKTECEYVDALTILLSEMVVLAEVYSKTGKLENIQASDRNFLDKIGTEIGTQVRDLKEFDSEKMKNCPKYKTYLDLFNKYMNLPQIFT